MGTLHIQELPTKISVSRSVSETSLILLLCFDFIQTQQISKRKRKKKQESLLSAPYHLKDGDIIGVKNLLLDDSKDFSTVRDDVGKQKQRQLALEKKKSRQAECSQDHVLSEEKLNIKHRKPEVALSINVGVFR